MKELHIWWFTLSIEWQILMNFPRMFLFICRLSSCRTIVSPTLINVIQYLPPANEVWAKVIFLHLSVILFTGGPASVHAGMPPTEQIPRWSRHPPEQTPPPPVQCTPRDTGNKRAVRILLECNLVVNTITTSLNDTSTFFTLRTIYTCRKQKYL